MKMKNVLFNLTLNNKFDHLFHYGIRMIIKIIKFKITLNNTYFKHLHAVLMFLKIKKKRTKTCIYEKKIHSVLN